MKPSLYLSLFIQKIIMNISNNIPVIKRIQIQEPMGTVQGLTLNNFTTTYFKAIIFKLVLFSD